MVYLEFSQEQQIAAVSNLVPTLLDQYSVQDAEFENINHGFNSSFKVTTSSGDKFALRINTNSKKSPSEIEGEVLLLEYLANNEVLNSPKPIRTMDGETFSRVQADFLDREILAVLCHWIDGEVIGTEASDQQLFELGAAMGMLHECAALIPSNLTSRFSKIDRTLFNSPDNLRKPDSRIDSELQRLIADAFKISDEVFQELAKQSERILIHADLHPFNALKTQSGLAVIDFDDVGIGYELQDLAITFFYLRDKPGKEEMVLDGYRSIRNLPQYKPNQIEALLVARQLLLLNDLLDVTTAEEIASTPEYIEITRLRLKNFLETGKFELIRRLS
jgi:Ser/Thr protein kinase RdoA (MazF antagonist)